MLQTKTFLERDKEEFLEFYLIAPWQKLQMKAREMILGGQVSYTTVGNHIHSWTLLAQEDPICEMA